MDNKPSILIIDDDKDTRKGLSKILGEKGYKICFSRKHRPGLERGGLGIHDQAR